MKNLFDQFFVGVKRHPWRFLTSIFLSYSVFWTVVESTTSFIKALSLEGVVPYLVMVGASVVIGIYRSHSNREKFGSKSRIQTPLSQSPLETSLLPPRIR